MFGIGDKKKKGEGTAKVVKPKKSAKPKKKGGSGRSLLDYLLFWRLFGKKKTSDSEAEPIGEVTTGEEGTIDFQPEEPAPLKSVSSAAGAEDIDLFLNDSGEDAVPTAPKKKKAEAAQAATSAKVSEPPKTPTGGDKTAAAKATPVKPGQSFVVILNDMVRGGSEGYYAVVEAFKGVNPDDKLAWKKARESMVQNLGKKLDASVKAKATTADVALQVCRDAIQLASAYRLICLVQNSTRQVQTPAAPADSPPVSVSVSAAPPLEKAAPTDQAADVGAVAEPDSDIAPSDDSTTNVAEAPDEAEQSAVDRFAGIPVLDGEEGLDIETLGNDDGADVFTGESLQTEEEGGTAPLGDEDPLLNDPGLEDLAESVLTIEHSKEDSEIEIDYSPVPVEAPKSPAPKKPEIVEEELGLEPFEDEEEERKKRKH